MKVAFICGCDSGPLLDVKSIQEGYMSLVGFDDDGMLICRNHGARRYGWRSLPMVALEANPDDPESIPPVKPDYNLASYTPLELERYSIFGVPLSQRVAQL